MYTNGVWFCIYVTGNNIAAVFQRYSQCGLSFRRDRFQSERKTQTLDRATHSSSYLGRQFGREVPSEVVLRRDQAGGVVDFDLQVGERVEERGVGHRDFI